MGSLWRSEPMQMVQIFVQKEAAHDTVEELGKIGLFEFIDVYTKSINQPTSNDTSTSNSIFVLLHNNVYSFFFFFGFFR